MHFTPDSKFSPASDPFRGRSAACVGLPLEEVRKFNGGGSAQAYVAKKYCSGCSARTACLEWALSFETPQHKRYGVYGGLTAEQRSELFGGDFEEAV